MSSITTSAAMDLVRQSISLTQAFAETSNQSSGVYRMRNFFIAASEAAASGADPVRDLKVARHEASNLYNSMRVRRAEDPGCLELQAYDVLCKTLNAIPACALETRGMAIAA